MYQMAINKIADFLKSEENRKSNLQRKEWTHFKASFVLSVVFGKSKEEILMKIVKCK